MTIIIYKTKIRKQEKKKDTKANIPTEKRISWPLQHVQTSILNAFWFQIMFDIILKYQIKPVNFFLKYKN